VALALTGPGRIAVDRLVPRLRSHRVAHGVAAIVLGAVLAGATLLLRH
jgi:putative oxidoreductase